MTLVGATRRGSLRSVLTRWLLLGACLFGPDARLVHAGAGPLTPQAAPSVQLDPALVASALERAAELPRLHTLIVARGGRTEVERRFRGPSLDTPVNVKSVSKSVLSALVGIAIHERRLTGPQQRIEPFFREYMGRGSDPRLHRITLGDLLSMRSGLARASGEGYGAWVASRNWMAHILKAPLAAEPGTTMLYSTGNSHLLSVVLTKATHSNTHTYARSRLARPLGIQLRRWGRDPQGYFIGGNQMSLSPRALVRFGELYRNGGRYGGKQVVPASWVEESLTPRTRSMFSGQEYGYGWFLAQFAGHAGFYAWGYGGQFVFVIPSLALTIVTTSQSEGPGDYAHLVAIQGIVRDYLVPAAELADAHPRG